jgi:predicted DNA-binding transcriptional regulator AlpA
MNDTIKNPFEPFFEEIRQVVREEIRALNGEKDREEERLLNAEEAAEILNVSTDWIYRNAKKLPFTRKLGPKMLRFSHQGIMKWSATRKLSS